MQSQLKILFIDDHVGLRDSLSLSLQKMNPLFKFYLAADMERARVYLKSNPDIRIAIVDLNLNGEDGLLLIDQIRALIPEIKIIIYTMYSDPMHIKNSLEKKIEGFITKDLELEEIKKAVIAVNDGKSFYCSDAQKILSQMNDGKSRAGGFFNSDEEKNDINARVCFKNYQTLTKKEQEVFLLLAQKLDDEENVNKILASLTDKAKVISVKKSHKLIESKPAFTTSTLQQEAYNVYHFSTSKTSRLAQELYEGVQIKGEHTGLITYIRTDSTYLSDTFVARAEAFIEEKFGKE